MVRTQIQLTEIQAERLRRLSATRGVSLAELIRQGVDAVLASDIQIDGAERRRRALAAAGRHGSGKKDGSRKHDHHLAEAFGT